MSEQIVWKVIKKETRRSAIIKGIVSRVYKKGLKVKPVDRDFPLMAFRTRARARFFREVGTSFDPKTLRVIKCLAKESEKKLERLIVVNAHLDYNIDNLKIGMYVSPPRGTVFCDWIKPLE